jgi:hypothetical protein
VGIYDTALRSLSTTRTNGGDILSFIEEFQRTWHLVLWISIFDSSRNSTQVDSVPIAFLS